MALYVRTTNGGTDPDVILYDLGITIATSVSWTLLSAAVVTFYCLSEDV